MGAVLIPLKSLLFLFPEDPNCALLVEHPPPSFQILSSISMYDLLFHILRSLVVFQEDRNH